MSEKSFEIIDPEAVIIAVNTIDRLIQLGDGDAALLYLYILRTSGKITQKGAAEALGKSDGWVASALARLSMFALVGSPDGIDDSMLTDEEAPKEYTIEEILEAKENDANFATLIDETQSIFGRHLKEFELKTLYAMYIGHHLPITVIILLINHCIDEAKMSGKLRRPSLSYIKKAADDWEKEELFTLELAEEYLKTLDNTRALRDDMKIAMGVVDRELKPSEKAYISSWIKLGYTAQAVEIAAELTMENTGERIFKYANSIILRWKKRGLLTVQDIVTKDSVQQNKTKGNDLRNLDEKFGVTTQEEFQRMERLLERLKND
ncbi:MAG: DnaD domain protein [Oscillospiraceae bacterium]|nr:DnaD domain protein [Oscillospiraceae bacterium]